MSSVRHTLLTRAMQCQTAYKLFFIISQDCTQFRVGDYRRKRHHILVIAKILSNTQ